MLLYHSFPRVVGRDMARKKSWTVAREIDVGLNVLSSILENGLLLTREDFAIPQDGTNDCMRTLKHPPKRACFTALSHPEIEEHSKIFGSFTIGLNAKVARLLGIMPTIYIYGLINETGNPSSDITDGGVPMELVQRLRDIHALCSAISIFESKAVGFKGHPTDVYSTDILDFLGWVPEKTDKNLDKIRNASRRVSKKIVERLPTERVSAQYLTATVEMILSMFQYAESETGELLDFYKQREWRFVEMFSQQVAAYPLDMDEFPEMLKSYYGLPEYHRQKIKNVSRYLSTATIRDSSLLIGADLTEAQIKSTKSDFLNAGWNEFRDFVEEILVPNECRNETTQLIEKWFGDFTFSTDNDLAGITTFRRRVV